MNPLNGWKPPVRHQNPPPVATPPARVAPARTPQGPLASFSNFQQASASFCEIAVPVDIERHVALRRKLLAEGKSPDSIPDQANLCAEDLLARESEEYRVLYATFVDQYMVDLDPRLAAIRCGFSGMGDPSEASIVAINLMGLPVVQRLIAEYTTGRRNGSATSLELIYAMLQRETQVNVSGSTQKGRLEAIKSLGELKGFIAKAPVDPANQLGVIEVPQKFVPIGQMDADAVWESVAVSSQKALKDSVRD